MDVTELKERIEKLYPSLKDDDYMEGIIRVGLEIKNRLENEIPSKFPKIDINVNDLTSYVVAHVFCLPMNEDEKDRKFEKIKSNNELRVYTSKLILRARNEYIKDVIRRICLNLQKVHKGINCSEETIIFLVTMYNECKKRASISNPCGWIAGIIYTYFNRLPYVDIPTQEEIKNLTNIKAVPTIIKYINLISKCLTEIESQPFSKIFKSLNLRYNMDKELEKGVTTSENLQNLINMFRELYAQSMGNFPEDEIKKLAAEILKDLKGLENRKLSYLSQALKVLEPAILSLLRVRVYGMEDIRSEIGRIIDEWERLLCVSRAASMRSVTNELLERYAYHIIVENILRNYLLTYGEMSENEINLVLHSLGKYLSQVGEFSKKLIEMYRKYVDLLESFRSSALSRSASNKKKKNKKGEEDKEFMKMFHDMEKKMVYEILTSSLQILRENLEGLYSNSKYKNSE